MLHALNICKILQITLLSLLACTAVYTAVFISANSEIIHIVHFISGLVVFHKKISIFHQTFRCCFFPGEIFAALHPCLVPGTILGGRDLMGYMLSPASFCSLVPNMGPDKLSSCSS